MSIGNFNMGLDVSQSPYLVRSCDFSWLEVADLISSICCREDAKVRGVSISVGFTSLSTYMDEIYVLANPIIWHHLPCTFDNIF